MDWKKIGKKLLFPPIWGMLVLAILSAAGLAWVFIGGHEQSPVSYGVYVLAFYTLTVITAFCAIAFPKRYRQIRQKILSVPLANRYVTDKVFRTKVMLLVSFGVNLLYAGVNVISYFLYRSMWFICLAVYYTILGVMRFLLVRYVRLNDIGTNRYGELKRAKACSYILLLLNLFLSGAVLMIVYQNKGYAYHGMMIYVMAMYTFYITTNAIVNLVKYKKFNSPVMSMAKVISMAAALVSMLNLETAMFAAFGTDMESENQRLMIILTGAGVAVTVITMSVYMIAKCAKEIKRMRSLPNGREK